MFKMLKKKVEIKSRKLTMAYIAMTVVAVGFLLTGLYPALGATFGEFIMGVLAAAGIYAGSNTLTKWGELKHKASVKSLHAPAEEAKEDTDGESQA